MLINTLITTLKSGLWTAILIGAVAAGPALFGRRAGRLFRNGLAAVIPTSVIFAYFFQSNFDARSYDLIASASAFVALLIIMILIWWPATMVERTRRDANRLGLLTACLAIVSAFGGLVSLALVPKSFLSATSGYLTTEVISNLSVFTAGLALTVALALAVAKSVSRLPPFRSAAWTTLALAPILIGQLTATVQMLLVSGRIAVTMWLFALIAWLINSRALLLSISLGTLLALAAATAFSLKSSATAADLNPAERRLIRAGRRLNLRLIVSLTLFAAIIGFFLASESVYADKVVALSPAKKVKAEGGRIRLPLKIIKNKRLHRFVFDDGGRKIRFIVVHKGSGVYGSGFDACANCGAVGYYEKGGNIICKNCDAYINVATLGLPGGCNPIPLRNRVAGDYLEIDVKSVIAGEEDRR